MTQYALIKTTDSMCRALADNNVNPCDVKYLEVYEQLERMEREGHKKTFIVAYLCNQYDIAKRRFIAWQIVCVGR